MTVQWIIRSRHSSYGRNLSIFPACLYVHVHATKISSFEVDTYEGRYEGKWNDRLASGLSVGHNRSVVTHSQDFTLKFPIDDNYQRCKHYAPRSPPPSVCCPQCRIYLCSAIWLNDKSPLLSSAVAMRCASAKSMSPISPFVSTAVCIQQKHEKTKGDM
jgi:hypothetical protein